MKTFTQYVEEMTTPPIPQQMGQSAPMGQAGTGQAQQPGVQPMAAQQTAQQTTAQNPQVQQLALMSKNVGDPNWQNLFKVFQQNPNNPQLFNALAQTGKSLASLQPLIQTYLQRRPT